MTTIKSRWVQCRAWDNGANEFVDDIVLDTLGNYYEADKCEYCGDDRNLTLTWYTGTVDTAGVKVCEGDVVDGNWPYAKRGIVTWDDARCGFYVAPFDADGFVGGSAAYDKGYKMNSAKMLVVGNVFENPELIKYQTPNNQTA